MPLWISIICIVAAVVIGAGAGIFLGIAIRKNTAEKEIGSAEEEAKKIVADAIKTAEARKKEVVLEGKDEVHRFRNESEKEISDRRKEVQRQERRIQQKEETLDKKLDNMERKEEKVNKKLRDADAKLEEVETLKKSQFEMLEKISGYTAEQAKSYLLSQLENELAHEKSVKIMEYTEQLKEEADDKARNIISLAIQRLAAEQVSEATISVVPLPNDEMKGRIIGREGRNIRAIETLTGVDLIIDDTPGITISELRSKCRKYKMENNLGLVIIDYLQLMSGNGKTDSRQQEISDISRSLKALARELDVPVVTLSQLSRAVEQRPDHRPMLSDLRESGAIEQDADVVMFLYRDDYYNKDTDIKGIAEIIIAKQRNGPIGTVKMAWIPEQTRFADLLTKEQIPH